MATKVRRKSNTAMVFNPSRGLSIGGRSPVRRAARKNPTARTSAAANPRHRKQRRRRRNPFATTSRFLTNPKMGMGGLLVVGVMAGVATSIFDIITQRVMPNQSPTIRIAVKAGGALFFQSDMGGKIPFFGKYKDDIALVLMVMAGADAFKLWVLPVLSQTIGNFTGQALQLLSPQQQAAPATLGNLYGNAAYQPSSYDYA